MIAERRNHFEESVIAYLYGPLAVGGGGDEGAEEGVVVSQANPDSVEHSCRLP